MKREVLLIFLMIVALLTGCQTAGQTSPELPTPENLYSTDNTIDMFVYQETAYVNAEDTEYDLSVTFDEGTTALMIASYYGYADLVNDKKISMGDKVNFTVPTGNFGDILAGFYAKCMSLPVNRLICASNSNNVLTDFLKTGTYDRNREFFKTISPSMDILISSNLERLLYHITNDATKVKSYMEKLQSTGCYQVDETTLKAIQETFSAGYLDDSATKKCIHNIYQQDNYVADTHTAVAWQVAQDYQKSTQDTTPMVVLSTASPYKFSDSVLSALGEDISDKDEFALLDKLSTLNKDKIPQGLAQLQSLPILHNNLCAKEDMIKAVNTFLNI